MSTTVEVVSPAPRDLWQKALSAESGALLSQTPEWLDTICAVDGWTDASRLYAWPSGRQLVLPMVGKRIGGFTTIEDSYPPGWGFGGLAGGTDVTPDEVADVFADLISRHVFLLHICPNCLQGDAWLRVISREPRRTAVSLRNAHAVDLEGGIDAIWKRFSENARRGIRKAEKQGLEVECDTTGRLFDAFEKLWLLSTQRWAAQDDEPVWLVRLRGRRFNPRNRWRKIAERTRGGVAVWVARHHGEPVASIVILRGPNDHYTRGAMHKELAGPTRANFLLHWLAIQDACQRGARWYQMGQSGFGDQVAHFKENFGARAYAFPELRLERLPISSVISSVKGIARASAKRLSVMSRRDGGLI